MISFTVPISMLSKVQSPCNLRSPVVEKKITIGLLYHPLDCDSSIITTAATATVLLRWRIHLLHSKTSHSKILHSKISKISHSKISTLCAPTTCCIKSAKKDCNNAWTTTKTAIGLQIHLAEEQTPSKELPVCQGQAAHSRRIQHEYITWQTKTRMETIQMYNPEEPWPE